MFVPSPFFDIIQLWYFKYSKFYFEWTLYRSMLQHRHNIWRKATLNHPYTFFFNSELIVPLRFEMKHNLLGSLSNSILLQLLIKRILWPCMKNELTANHKQTDRNIKTDHYLKVEGICSLKDSFDIIKPKPLASWISHTLADFPLNNKPISSWQKKKRSQFQIHDLQV